MSYQVLARKWRPRDFTTLVGQEHVVRALTHALEQQRLHHAYLFTGTRGVGKTTLSRILAKALNCTGADGNGGITAQPCGVCKACTEIDAGRFVDYIEMDAASNRGVDEMAQLLDKAVYAPTVGRFKVYMIDEVHMLTNHAFNAMLKTLEEPPGHVKFILATTDPQKIPVTVLSRCLQFNLKQMPPGHIVSHLDRILAEEGIAHDGNALRLLAQAAHGSMRDALSLTDQAIAYSAGEVSEASVRGMLGAIDQSYLVQLLDALAAEDGAAMLAVADSMADRSLSFAGALQDLGSLLHKIALAQAVPASVQEEWPEAGEVRRLAAAFDPQEVQLFYQIANLGRSELALAPDEYAGFTMTLLRMLAFRPSAMPSAPTPAGPAATGARRMPGPAMAGVAGAAAASAPAVSTATAASAASAPTPSPVAAGPATGATIAAAAPVAVPGPRPAPSSPMASGAAFAAAAPAPTPAAPASAAAAPAPGARPANDGKPLSPARAALAAARQASAGRGGASARPAAAAPAPAPVPAAVPAPTQSLRPAAPQRRAEPPRPPAQAPAHAAPSAAPAAEPPPWELAGGGDVPPWEELPPDLPLIGPYDSEPEPQRAAPLRRPEPPRTAMPAPSAAADEAFAPSPNKAPPAAAPLPPDDGTPAIFDGDWPALAASLPLKGLAQQLAYQSELARVQGRTFVLRAPVAAIAEGNAVERLAQALSDHFGEAVRVHCEVGAVSETAAAADAQARAERQRAAEAAIENDPFVQGLLREFGGQIVPGSIQPRAL
ncbi:DNA polymerase III subunit gamma/tau [Cupriavidus gilardii]|uniref:DNA polymerase III subunit gamma/tau n=1 Tax=Cupriavidus gilardii TaxID=82541 RepID=UPI001580A205|nr:DNA polymerase III subunit gamma/tau [Cupriavidus gilardii]MCT9072475.1 DNA polymerase III subunit gamma/tau [Cupriavidus gilardii]QKS63943.1 DNA polymerase III subunit gamma/tau [Cupriavidus gilardii]